MSLPRRLRNIALSQIKAIRDRLDRIDAEAAEEEAAQQRAERSARQELKDEANARPTPTLRTPEEIASGAPRPAMSAAPQPASPLAIHYRVLGLEEGADLGAIEAAYHRLAKRCAPERFPEGSEEQQAAQEIFKRVDAAYNALRDALDPTAGRFDKLEI